MNQLIIDEYNGRSKEYNEFQKICVKYEKNKDFYNIMNTHIELALEELREIDYFKDKDEIARYFDTVNNDLYDHREEGLSVYSKMTDDKTLEAVQYILKGFEEIALENYMMTIDAVTMAYHHVTKHLLEEATRLKK